MSSLSSTPNARVRSVMMTDRTRVNLGVGGGGVDIRIFASIIIKEDNLSNKKSIINNLMGEGVRCGLIVYTCYGSTYIHMYNKYLDVLNKKISAMVQRTNVYNKHQVLSTIKF
jgi:hypothetical protein